MATLVTSTIGTSGRDYSTLTGWEGATDYNLVAADEQHDGEAYDDSVFTTNVKLLGAVVDATRYRRLLAASGEEYDPRTDTGVRMTNSARRGGALLDCGENYNQIHHIRVESTYSGSLSHNNVRLRKIGQLAVGITSVQRDATGVCRCFIFTTSVASCCFVSCLALGGGAGGDGASFGFMLSNGLFTQGWQILHCLAFGIARGAGTGFYGVVGLSFVGSPSYVTNCGAYDCYYDWDLSFPPPPWPQWVTVDRCFGSDTTTPGTNVLDNRVATTEHLDPGETPPVDFRLEHEGSLVRSGATVAPTRPSIVPGVDHGDADPGGASNRGPYDGAIMPMAASSGSETSMVATLDLELWLAAEIPVYMGGVAALTLRVAPGTGGGPSWEVWVYRAIGYLAQLIRLLPRGLVWVPKGLRPILWAAGDEAARIEDRGRDLLRETDPHTTDELLADWERVLGLPEVCTDPPQTALARRQAVLRKFRDQGGQSPTYMIAAAATLGYVIAIVEYQPMRAGPYGPGNASKAGDALTQGAPWAHTWTVVAPLLSVQTFAAGSGRCNEPLATWANAPLECLLGMLKPAHTLLLFQYTGQEETTAESSGPPGSGPYPAASIMSWPTH